MLQYCCTRKAVSSYECFHIVLAVWLVIPTKCAYWIALWVEIKARNMPLNPYMSFFLFYLVHTWDSYFGKLARIHAFTSVGFDVAMSRAVIVFTATIVACTLLAISWCVPEAGWLHPTCTLDFTCTMHIQHSSVRRIAHEKHLYLPAVMQRTSSRRRRQDEVECFIVGWSNS